MVTYPLQYIQRYILGEVQDCSNSIANAMELLQSCAIDMHTVHILFYYGWFYPYPPELLPNKTRAN